MTYTTDCSTWREITGQPEIWRNWADPLANEAASLRRWIQEQGIRHIWFLGAGTSAFIGDTLAAMEHPDFELRSVATTDFVAAPQDFFPLPDDLLIVQFGRSGDSSESVGTMDLLDNVAPQVRQLNITCNADGLLATRPAPRPGVRKVLLLPAATHDAGFAMTSSFTTMLLSALALLDDNSNIADRLRTLSDSGAPLLAQLKASIPHRPERVIFLGSGMLKGIARESALKVLELSAGQVVTQWDSTLGFRHGPKAAISGDTSVVVLIHPDQRTARYDIDVAEEIKRQFPAASVLTIGPGACDIPVPADDTKGWCTVLYVLAAQVWAVMWSDALGLNIDDPFKDHGNLSRVVAGVTLYPFQAESA